VYALSRMPKKKIRTHDLTSRQKEILEVLARAARRGETLSVRDIAEALGVRSPATVYQHLRALVRKGYVAKTGRSRRYRPLKLPPGGSGIPVVGVVQAGAPFESQEGWLGELPIERDALDVRGEVVALQVRGDSMVEAGIYDGDFVLIRRQSTVAHGDIAAVLVNGEGTLKRVHLGGRRVRLTPANSRFPPIVLRKNDDVRIYGKLVGVIHGDFRLRFPQV